LLSDVAIPNTNRARRASRRTHFLETPVLGTVLAEEHRDGGAGSSAAQQVTSISGPPAGAAFQAAPRAIDATRIPHLGRELRKRQLPLDRSCIGFDHYRRIIMRRSHAGTGKDRKMQRSMTRIRTSHVGRLPPPKGWQDMPGRLASAEITDPSLIAAQVTPAIAETVKQQVEVGIELHRRRRVLDSPQPRPLHRAFHWR